MTRWENSREQVISEINGQLRTIFNSWRIIQNNIIQNKNTDLIWIMTRRGKLSLSPGYPQLRQACFLFRSSKNFQSSSWLNNLHLKRPSQFGYFSKWISWIWIFHCDPWYHCAFSWSRSGSYFWAKTTGKGEDGNIVRFPLFILFYLLPGCR